MSQKAARLMLLSSRQWLGALLLPADLQLVEHGSAFAA